MDRIKPTRKKCTCKVKKIILKIVIISEIFCFCLPLYFLFKSRLNQDGCQYRYSEAKSYLGSIRTGEEAYFAQCGSYLECKLSPPNSCKDRNPDLWIDAGGFSEIGFAPTGPVCYQYSVTVSEDGKSFVAKAIGDGDGDGIQETYTISEEGDVKKEPPEGY